MFTTKTATKFTKTLALTGMAVSAMTIATPAFTAHAYGSGEKAAAATEHKSGAFTKVATGTFEGRSDHITTGGAHIVKVSNGYLLVLGDDFSLDGAPAPTIGFGNDGQFDKESEFAKLAKITGKQVYNLPADFTPANYSEVYVWCADFSVPLGVATLETK